jgi:hypothetical protein
MRSTQITKLGNHNSISVKIANHSQCCLTPYGRVITTCLAKSARRHSIGETKIMECATSVAKQCAKTAVIKTSVMCATKREMMKGTTMMAIGTPPTTFARIASRAARSAKLSSMGVNARRSTRRSATPKGVLSERMRPRQGSCQ